MMAFFVPVVHSSNLDNELGPGIYTSDSLEWVLKFASANSALMVFKDVDFRQLNVWSPPSIRLGAAHRDVDPKVSQQRTNVSSSKLDDRRLYQRTNFYTMFLEPPSPSTWRGLTNSYSQLRRM